ncbi:MAG: diguanylate cyclase [Actinobacteria bacterium]|nr:diguanylate cyclase [Actinomycetota bacterium]
MDVGADDQAALRARLQATIDSFLDPHVFIEAVRDESGTIVDFVFLDANEAACTYNSRTRQEMIGARLMEILPGHAASGILADYAQVVETGEPIIVDALPYFNEIIGEVRQSDLRCIRVGEQLSVTWRDVSDRVAAAESARIARELLQSTLDSLLDPHVYLQAVRDGEGRIIDFVYEGANDAASVYNQVARADLLGMRLLELLPGQAGSGLLALYAGVLESGQPAVLDDFLYPHEVVGEDRWFDMRVNRAGDGLSVTWRDVTDRHDYVSALADSQARYRILAENASDIVAHLRGATIVWVSPAVTRILGWEPDELVGLLATDIIHPDEVQDLVEQMSTRLETEQSRMRFRLRAKNGAFHWFDVLGSPLIGSDGAQDGRVAAFRLVDDEVAARTALEMRARQDDLTGLVNRQEMFERVGALFRRSSRTGREIAMVFCDVDDLKKVNDSFGHAAGDELLRMVASRLSTSVRGGDVVARIGGDELLVVLDGVHDLDQAEELANKLRAIVAEPALIGEQWHHVTMSVGVTLAVPGEDVDAVVARADEAMYTAKNGGRDRVVAV